MESKDRTWDLPLKLSDVVRRLRERDRYVELHIASEGIIWEVGIAGRYPAIARGDSIDLVTMHAVELSEAIK